MPISVLVADDTAIMRKAILELLSSDREVSVVGEAADFRETVKLMKELKPRVLVMDLHMPGDKGSTLNRLRVQLKRDSSYLLAISIWNDSESRALAESFDAKQLLDKMSLGATLLPAIAACL